VRSSIVSSSLLSGQPAFRSEKTIGSREKYDVMLCNRGESVRSEGVGRASAVEFFGLSFLVSERIRSSHCDGLQMSMHFVRG